MVYISQTKREQGSDSADVVYGSSLWYLSTCLHRAPILDGILPDEDVWHAAPEAAAAAAEQPGVDLGDSSAVCRRRFVGVVRRLEHHLQSRRRHDESYG